MSLSEDWEKRQLCPDGACVGVIGDNRVCSVCGLAAEDGDFESSDSDEDEDEDEDFEDEADEQDEDEADEEGLSANAEAEADANADEDRVLCPDGTCVGLIGPDGTCKICGARARD